MSRKEGIPVKHRCDLPDTIELLGHRIQSALSIVLFSSGLLTLILCLAPSAGAAEDDAQAQAKMRSWVSAKFLGEPQTPAPVPFLLPNLDVKDSVVMRNAIQGHALLIAGHVFDHGLAMRSTGEIRVVLPSGARSFHAIAGVDSNDVFSYSNAGRGSVIASLRTAGSELFRSPVLHEGSPGVDVKVELHGAREFTLRLAPVGERPPAYQKDWDQADCGLVSCALARRRRLLPMFRSRLSMVAGPLRNF
jgi:hypothetical protein